MGSSLSPPKTATAVCSREKHRLGDNVEQIPLVTELQLLFAYLFAFYWNI